MISVLHGVCHLKCDAQNSSAHKMKCEKADEPLPPGKDHERNHNHVGIVNDFENEKQHPLLPGMLFVFVRAMVWSPAVVPLFNIRCVAHLYDL